MYNAARDTDANMIQDMMRADLHLITKGVYLQEGEYTVENYYE